jgi:hypothetical protein
MDVERRIGRIASKQLGVIGREQALEAGLSRGSIGRRLKQGKWMMSFPGVYLVAGAPRSWQQTIKAALVWADDDAVASHSTAAVLLGLGEIRPGLVEISIPRSRRAPKGVLAHRVGPLPSCDVASLGSLRVTTVARTLIDLGAVVDRDAVEIAMEDAIRRRLTSTEQLQRRLSALASHGKRGPATLKQILDDRFPGNWKSGSTFEVKVLQAIRRGGFPLPIPQFEVTANGQVAAQVDFAYPKIMLIIECESYEHHSDREPWYKDVRRYNEVATLGWRLYRATEEDVRNPVELLRSISVQLNSHSESKRARIPVVDL